MDDILSIYKNIYFELVDVELKICNKEDEKVCIGKCQMKLIGDFVMEGKMRYKKTKAEIIYITKNDKDVVFTLLHEISHAITPYYERKVKDKWICMDHTDKFYKNFVKICEIAYDKKIINKKYDYKSLIRRDANK